MTDILPWILTAVSIPFLIVVVRLTVRRARELSERIDEYHREQEEAKQQPGPINPYQDMAQAFGVEPPAEDKKQEEGQ